MANVFEAEVSAAAKHLGLHYQKLLVGTMRGDSRFTLKAPYDSFLVYEGRHVAMELKSMELHGSLPLGNIATHQIEGLLEASRHGCPAWLLVNMRRKKAGAKTTSENAAWYLPIDDWEALIASLPPGPGGQPRKSVPYPTFTAARLFRPLPRTHVASVADGKRTLVWDLRVLLPD